MPEIESTASQPLAPVQQGDALFAAVYERLKAMARRQRANVGATLNTTALVHELYLKLSASGELIFAEPAQFFDYAAQAMRHILVDRARERMCLKRGGDVVVENEDAAMQVADGTAERTLELDDGYCRQTDGLRDRRKLPQHLSACPGNSRRYSRRFHCTRCLQRRLRR